MPNLGPNFYSKLVKMTSELGMKPEDLIAVMISESGMNPSAHNPNGGASGLVQFMPSTLRGMGFPGTTEDFRRLSGEEQLPWIKKLIQGSMSYQGGKPFTSGGHYYVANLWPVALKLPGVQKGDPNTIIIEKSPQADGAFSKKYLNVGAKIKVGMETAAYYGNKVFDRDKKGYITLGDLNQQIDQNRKSGVYQNTMTSMQKSTGYKPDSVLPVSEQKGGNMDTVLDQYVKMLSAQNHFTKKMYKKLLPSQDILIQIAAPDYTSAVEFARILCATLDEELLSTSYPHTDSKSVEIECCIPGPAQACFDAVQQLSEVTAEVFRDATNKIGGLTVKVNCIMNKKSSYYPISLKTSDTNYRKFLLKLI